MEMSWFVMVIVIVVFTSMGLNRISHSHIKGNGKSYSLHYGLSFKNLKLHTFSHIKTYSPTVDRITAINAKSATKN